MEKVDDLGGKQRRREGGNWFALRLLGRSRDGLRVIVGKPVRLGNSTPRLGSCRVVSD